jgi:hypothetical protein
MTNVQHLDQIDGLAGSMGFRAVNRIVRDLDRDRVAGEHDFVCECQDETCTRVLRMTGAEYDALRADADCFAVLPGHERWDAADVVGRTDSYVIVRRRQPAAQAPSPPSRSAA